MIAGAGAEEFAEETSKHAHEVHTVAVDNLRSHFFGFLVVVARPSEPQLRIAEHSFYIDAEWERQGRFLDCDMII